jgi:hypothetical protein
MQTTARKVRDESARTGSDGKDLATTPTVDPATVKDGNLKQIDFNWEGDA